GGAEAGPERCRLGARHAHDPRDQVPQIATGPTAPHGGPGAGGLRAVPRPLPSDPANGRVLRVGARHPVARREGPDHLPGPAHTPAQPPRPEGRAPRIYDMRHTFACRRLLRWYADGADLDHAVPTLSTYLGHAQVSDTIPV